MRPIAILMVSLGKRRLSEELSGAFNHAPDSNEPASSCLDLEISSVQWSRRASNMCWTTAWYQDLRKVGFSDSSV